MIRLARVLSIASFVLLILPAMAAAQGGPATRYVRQRNEEVDHLLSTPASPTRDQQITAILTDLLDFAELSRRALGSHWTTLTPAQQTEFSGLLQQLVERNYRDNLEHIREYQVTYTGEETTADGVVVHMSARSRASRREEPFEINYSMHLVGSSWRVYDVVTNGSDLVRNYQQQFNRIITRDGFDALLTRMRDRLAHPEGAGHHD